MAPEGGASLLELETAEQPPVNCCRMLVEKAREVARPKSAARDGERSQLRSSPNPVTPEFPPCEISGAELGGGFMAADELLERPPSAEVLDRLAVEDELPSRDAAGHVAGRSGDEQAEFPRHERPAMRGRNIPVLPTNANNATMRYVAPSWHLYGT